MLYPTQIADNGNDNDFTYLPLKEQATRQEILDGRFACFTPVDDLDIFIKKNSLSEEFEVNGGKVNAVSEKKLKDALDKENTFVLRAERFLRDSVRSKQKWE
jgi:hypothetical protein